MKIFRILISLIVLIFFIGCPEMPNEFIELLPTPSLVSPVNNSIIQTSSQFLDWNSVDGATSYTLQVSLSNAFTSFVYNENGLTSTSAQIIGLSNSTTYYWRVNATNNAGTSSWSSTWNFKTGTVPVNPTLLLPGNDSTNQSTDPTLSWNAISEAASYTLQVSTSSTFADFVYNQSGLTNTSWQITRLSNSTTYYWRVSATNNYGASSWSSTWNFTTVSTAPVNPTLLSPDNSSTNQSTNPILSWNAVNEVISYTLQVSTSSTFADFVYNQNGLTNTSWQIIGLSNSTTYYWRVSATNNAGTSSWSSTWNFTTVSTAPVNPTLLSPGNSSTNQSTNPILSWNAVNEVISYTLQVSTSSTFADFVYNQNGLTNTSWQITGLSNSTTYYWRVNATNSLGTSDWSNAWSFTTEETTAGIPSVPTLLSPSNSSTSQPLNLLLSWNTISEAISYTFQVSTSSAFTDFVYNQSELTNTSLQITELSNSTTYYWRVNATNSFGTSDWSNTWSFTTEETATGIPSVPTLLSPSNSSTSQPLNFSLSWNAVSEAISYTFQVSTSSEFTDFVYNQSGLTSTNIQIIGLSNSTIYYWRVNATNNSGTSNWSSTWIFTTGTAPSNPTLSSPSSGSTSQPTNLFLSWNEVTETTSYTLQISTSNEFSSFIYNQSGLTSTSVQITGLSNSTIYYWRVSATNNFGISNWSNIWYFTTVGDRPEAPALSLPLNNSTEQSLTPTLVWNASTNTTSYTFQVSLDVNFGSFVYNQDGLSSTSIKLTGLSYSTKYYWRVLAINNYGTSDWSSIRSFTTLVAVPGIQTLLSPTNGSIGQSISPILEWNENTNADGYSLQLSSSISFANLIYSQDGLTFTSTQISGLSGSCKYYWRVRASNNYGTSNWSDIWNFTTEETVVGVPILISPSNGSSEQSITPTLIWNADANAESYTLQVSSNNNFTNLVFDQSGLASANRQITGLSYSTTYYWRVYATEKYGLGNTSWSNTWSFTTMNLLPSIPALISPTNSSTIQSTDDTVLNWNPSNGATGYTLQVSTNSLFSNFIYNESGLTVTSKQITGLTHSTTYYWRVCSSNDVGTLGWSDTWNFSTKSLAPSRPVLISPDSGKTTGLRYPQMSWNSSSGAESYTLQISTSSSFSSFRYNQSGITSTSQEIYTLLSSTKYYWRVSATNNYGTSDWSNTWTFNSWDDRPVKPTLNSPSNNSLNQPLNPTLTWNSVNAASSYTIQVSTSFSFAYDVKDQTGLTNTSAQITGLANSRTYYWRVNASNALGTSTWSDTWSFITESAGNTKESVLRRNRD